MIPLISLVLLLIFTFGANTVYAAGEPEPRDWEKLTTDGVLNEDATKSHYAVILDAHTGKVLYEENSNTKKFPASITKIMTGLLVAENADMDEYVQITDINITDGLAKMVGLAKGELITVRDLLYALMLESGNDAAVALAMHVGGSLQGFANMMNARAVEVGMIGTNYVNPHGLHDEQQFTTAMDMAILAYTAMKNEIFREVVGTYRHLPPTTNIHGAETTPWPEDIWENLNSLISERASDDYAFINNTKGNAIGIKTGYTTAAQATLVGAAQSKDGTQEVITVVLDDTKSGRWVDSTTMFMYAFEFYDTIDLVKLLISEETISTHVDNAKTSDTQDNLQMTVMPTSNAYITDTKDTIQAIFADLNRFNSVQNITTPLVAPIAIGQQVGTVEYFLDGGASPVLTCNLIAANVVEVLPEATPIPTVTPVALTPTATPENRIVGFIDNDKLIYVVIGITALLFVIIIIAMVSRNTKQKKQAAASRSRQSTSRNSDGARRGRGRRR